jgi:hypothetical protein
MYGFYKSRQLDGTLDKGPRYGSHCLTAARIAMGWGTVAEQRWPMPRGKVDWPPQEPPGLDKIARFNRTFSHFRIRTLSDARYCLFLGGPFTFSLPITKQWHTAPKGVVAIPKSTVELVESHAVTAVGYSDDNQQLKFINSWGPNWGDKGYGYLPYSYFETYLTDAWARYPGKMRKWAPRDISGAALCTRSYVYKLVGKRRCSYRTLECG